MSRLIDVAKNGRQYVDRYELIGEIASGGMATVYLARATGVGGFQRLFALKRLHPHLASEARFVEMFLDEARLAARIHHPNVVPILEVGAHDAGYYLLMEHIEGDTLARLVARAAARKGHVPGPIVLRILLDTLAGLHAAHELRDDSGRLYGVVHRDVSPQNVLVGHDGIARITDFGVARATARLSLSRVGQLKGKIAYMSPEQASGDGVDRRADVFSAGVVLWECLASRRLFKSTHDAATLSRVMSGPIPHIGHMCPGIDPELASAVMRALERQPEQRYASAAEFAEALERAARDHVGTRRDLAAYIEETLGPEIRLHQRAVREWLAQHEPGPVPASGTQVSFGARSSSTPRAVAAPVPAPEAGERKRRPLVWLGLAAVAGAVTFGSLLMRRSDERGVPPTGPASGSQVGVLPERPAGLEAARHIERTPEASPIPSRALPESEGAPAHPATAESANKPHPLPLGNAQRGARRAAQRSPGDDRGKKRSRDLDLTNPYR